MKNKDFKDLLASIDQARRIHTGKLKAGRIFKFNPIIVKNIRMKLHASQVEFAQMIGISVDTLQNWEQGRRRPEGPAMALLKVAEADPETVMKALHR
jgi:putative transcriptional regulator